MREASRVLNRKERERAVQEYKSEVCLELKLMRDLGAVIKCRNLWGAWRVDRSRQGDGRKVLLVPVMSTHGGSLIVDRYCCE
jgi:hypothetical protein